MKEVVEGGKIYYVTIQSGTINWKHKGQLHREEGPAIIKGDLKNWFYEGQLHREGGPAIEDKSGRSWAKNGVLHRVNGPAVEFFGEPEKNQYWVDGIQWNHLPTKEEILNRNIIKDIIE